MASLQSAIESTACVKQFRSEPNTKQILCPWAKDSEPDGGKDAVWRG